MTRPSYALVTGASRALSTNLPPAQ